MSIFIGQLGRLIELKGPSSQSLAVDDGMTFETTLEGRVKAQVRPLQRRTWGVGTSVATPPEIGALAGFASGEWGPGPFVWVSADAPVTNMLTPAQATCDPSTLYTAGVTATGPLSLGKDGWAGRSFTNTTPATQFYFGPQGAPVLPGKNATASAYLVGAGAAVKIIWLDPAGAVISASTGPATGVAGTATRASVTATAPANAAAAQVVAVNASQGARPCLTWSDQAYDWGDGQGCPKAVLSGLGRQTVLALRGPSEGRFTDASFLVTEVG